MPTFLESLAAQQQQQAALAMRMQNQRQPAVPPPSFSQFRQARAAELGLNLDAVADAEGDAAEQQIAQQYKQLFVPELGAAMGVRGQPSVEQLAQMEAQFDAGFQRMMAAKRASLGVPTAPPPAQRGMLGWLGDAALGTARGGFNAVTGFAVNAPAEIGKFATALGEGVGLVSPQAAERSVAAVNEAQNALNESRANVSEGLGAMMSQQAQAEDAALAQAFSDPNFAASAKTALTTIASTPRMWPEIIAQIALPMKIGASMGRAAAVKGATRAGSVAARAAGASADDIAFAGREAARLAAAAPQQAAKLRGALAGSVLAGSGTAIEQARMRFAAALQDEAQLQSLVSSPDYQARLAENGGDHALTLQQLQDRAGLVAGAASAVINGLAAKATPAIISKLVGQGAAQVGGAAAAREIQPVVQRVIQAANQPGGPLTKMVNQLRAVGGSMPAITASFEGGTSFIDMVGQNLGLQSTGIDMPAMTGAGAAAVQGFLGGGAFGLGGDMMRPGGGIRPAQDPAAAPPADGAPPPAPGDVPPDGAPPVPPGTDPLRAEHAADTIALLDGVAPDWAAAPTVDSVLAALQTPRGKGRGGVQRTLLDDMVRSWKADYEAAQNDSDAPIYNLADPRAEIIAEIAQRTGLDPAVLEQRLLPQPPPAKGAPTIAVTEALAAAARAVPGVTVTGEAGKPQSLRIDTMAALNALRALPEMAAVDFGVAEAALQAKMAKAQADLDAFADDVAAPESVRARDALGAATDAEVLLRDAAKRLASDLLPRATKAAEALELGAPQIAVDQVLQRVAESIAQRSGQPVDAVLADLKARTAAALAPKPTPEQAAAARKAKAEAESAARKAAADQRAADRKAESDRKAAEAEAAAKAARDAKAADKAQRQAEADAARTQAADAKRLADEAAADAARVTAVEAERNAVTAELAAIVKDQVLDDMAAGLVPVDQARAVDLVATRMAGKGKQNITALAQRVAAAEGLQLRQAVDAVIEQAALQLDTQLGLDGSAAPLRQALTAKIEAARGAKTEPAPPAPKPAEPEVDVVQQRIEAIVRTPVLREMEAIPGLASLDRAAGAIVAALARRSGPKSQQQAEITRIAEAQAQRDGMGLQDATDTVLQRIAEEAAPKARTTPELLLAAIRERLPAVLRGDPPPKPPAPPKAPKEPKGKVDPKAKPAAPPAPQNPGDAPALIRQEPSAQKKRADAVSQERLNELAARARIDPDSMTDAELADLVVGRFERSGMPLDRNRVRIVPLRLQPRQRRMVDALARVFGRRVVGLDAGDMVGGVTFPRDHRLIFVSPRSKNPIASVIAHEFAHTLDFADGTLGSRLRQVIRGAVGDRVLAQYRQRLDAQGRLGETGDPQALLDRNADVETLADFVSDALVDGRLLERLAARDRGLFFEVAARMRQFLEDLGQQIADWARGTKRDGDTLGARQVVEDFAALKRQIEHEIEMAAQTPERAIMGDAGLERQPLPAEEMPALMAQNRERGSALARSLRDLIRLRHTEEQDPRGFWSRLVDTFADNTAPWYREKLRLRREGRLTEDQDVYDALTRQIGRTGDWITADTDQVVTPMVETMKAAWRRLQSNTGLMAKWGIKNASDFVGILGFIRYAQHAPERNRQMMRLTSTLDDDAAAARRAAVMDYQDGTITRQELDDELDAIYADPDNVIRLKTKASGMTDQQAADVIREAKQDGLFEVVDQITPQINEAVQRTLAHQREAGLIGKMTQRMLDWYGYKHYVPVKGTAFAKDADPTNQFKASKYFANNFDTEIRLTGGRGELGETIMGALVADMQRASFNRGSQEVTQTLRRLVDAGNLPDATAQRLRRTEADEYGRYLPPGARISKEGKVTYPDEGFTAYDGDRATRITVPDESLKSSLMRQAESLAGVERGLTKLSQLQARLLTQANPNFWLKALGLDILSYSFGTLAQYGPKAAARFVINLAKQGLIAQSIPATVMSREKVRQLGARRPTGFFGQMNELDSLGGISYFGDGVADPKAGYNLMEQRLGQMVGQSDVTAALTEGNVLQNARQGKVGAMLAGLPAGLFNGLVKLGNGFELAARVAAFKALKDSGVSPKKAAAVTKDFMDFNKTGQLGGRVGAWYIFFRPAATGAVTAWRQVFDTPYGKQAALGYLAASFILFGMTVGAMKPEERRKFSKDGMMRNVILPDGEGNFIQIPEAYGPQRALGAIGRILWMVGEGDMDAAEGAFQLGLALKENVSALPQTNVNPFRPGADISNEGLKLLVQLLPTQMRNLVQPAANMNNQGDPLHIPESWLGNRFQADAGKPSTPDIYQEIARGILSLSNDAVDVAPETVKYVADQLGVVGQTVNNISYARQDADRQGREVTATDVANSIFTKGYTNRDRQFTPSRRFQALQRIYEKDAKIVERYKQLSATGAPGIEPPTQQQQQNAARLKSLRSQYKRMNDVIQAMPDGPQKEEQRKAIAAWQETEVEAYNSATGERM